MLTVNPVNDAPAAQDLNGATDEDATFNGALMATDVDVEPQPLTYSIVAPVDGVTVNSDGTFSVAPQPADQGLDDGESRDVTFQYVANDGTVNSAPGTATITINGANDAPVTSDAVASTDEDTAVSGLVSGSTIDVDGEALTFRTVGSTPAGLSFLDDGSWTFDPTGNFDYLGAGQPESVSFGYRAEDGDAHSNTSTVTIALTGVNDAPVANPDDRTWNVNGTGGKVLANDTDPDDGDSASLKSFEGTVIAEGEDAFFQGAYGGILVQADGTWAYGLDMPAPSETVDDIFTYTITDSYGATASSTLTIQVPGTGSSSASFTSSAAAVTITDTPATIADDTNAGGGGAGGNGNGTNDAPVAVADCAHASDASGNVLTNDMGDSLFVTEVNGNPVDGADVYLFGSYGSLLIDYAGTWGYQLNGAGTDALAQGTSVDDVFGYTIADASGATASSTLTIHITDAGDCIL
jgi:VCBS repeat-containing protein